MHSNHPAKMKIWNRPALGTIAMASRGAAWAMSEKVTPVVEESNQASEDSGWNPLDPLGPR